MRTLFARHPAPASALRPGVDRTATRAPGRSGAHAWASGGERHVGSSGSFPWRSSCFAPQLARSFALALLAGVALSGCGGAPMASGNLGSEDPDAALDRAEAAIYAKLGTPPGGPAPATTAAPGTDDEGPTPPAPPASPSDVPTTQAPHHEASRPESGGGEAEEPGACETACDALSSMERAVERVCVVAGPTHERCTRARDRLGRARQTVTSACETCDA